MAMRLRIPTRNHVTGGLGKVMLRLEQVAQLASALGCSCPGNTTGGGGSTLA